MFGLMAEPLDIEPLDIEPLDIEPLDIEPLDMPLGGIAPEVVGGVIGVAVGEAVLPGDMPGDVSTGALVAPVGAGAGVMVWAPTKCVEIMKAAEASQSVRMILSWEGVDFALAS
jgi:hypothetical protein